MSKISELSDGGALQSTDYLIAVRSGGNVKVQANGNLSLGDLTLDGLSVGTSTQNETLVLGSSDSGSNFLQITNSTTTAANDRGFYIGIDANENARINQRENADLVFSTNDTEAARIDSSGNVGIGTTSPSESLETTGNIQIKYAGSNADPSGARYLYFNNTDTTLVADQPLGGLSWINNDASATAGEAAYVKAYATTNTGRAELRFGTGDQNAPAQAMVIDASGNVGIGTTPSNKLDVGSAADPAINMSATADGILRLSGGGYSFAIANNDTGTFLYNNGSSRAMVFGLNETERMRIDSSGNVGLGNGAYIGTLSSSHSLSIQGGAGAPGGKISLYGGTGSNRIDFLIGASEAMRIDSSGNLLVGTTSVSTDPGVQIFGAGNIFTHIAGTAGADSMRFYRNSVEVGSITTTGTTTTYNTSSDARLKENIADAEDAGAKVDAIQVRQFDWKADGSHQDYGMVAQELLTVAPEAVSGDPESDDMMGVDYSKLVPMLVKEIQSLRARVAQLEGA
jgi:hypothetical protein